MVPKIKIKPQIIRTIASSLDFLALIVGGIIFIIISKFESFGFLIFGICIILFGSIQFTKHLKTFYLYDNELIVRYVINFTFNTDSIFKLSEIERIEFKKGRGPYMVINLKNSEKIFSIDFSEKDIDNFVFELNKLGVKTLRKNI